MAWSAVIVLIAMQVVPYGRNRGNPPAARTVAFDSKHTESLARQACFDCHSNQTRWPWYASVAPISWRLYHDVTEGREHLNFSALDKTSSHAHEAIQELRETIVSREMPPRDYLLLHPEARLTVKERHTLAAGLERSLASFTTARMEDP